MIAGPDYCQTGNKELCCGCTACENVCPVSAIQMKRDSEGFLYPVLDEAICIGCHLCERVCPFGKDKNIKPSTQAWAAVHKNEEVLKSSSSGGVFTALSDIVLEEKGVVVGSVMQDNQVVHCIAENRSETEQMRGSKYVQSELGNIFKQMRSRIKAGETVLFSGTPCQCAAARKVIGENEKLLTVDFVCHGVPSPAVWNDYVEYRAAMEGDVPQYISLRAKLKHKMGIYETYKDSNQKIHHVPAYDSPYLTGFLAGMLSRPSCYNCPYAGRERVSDITICDYWGYAQQHKEFNPEDGISAVLINTERGLGLWKKAQDSVCCHQSTVEQVALNNANLNHATEKPAQRDAFFRDRKTEPFKTLIAKYLTDSKAAQKRLIAKIPYPIKKVLKKLMR